MDGYSLIKDWYSYVDQNPRNVKPIHHAIVSWIIEKANLDRWKEEFQLPTDEACRFTGASDRKIFLKGLKEVEKMGAIKILQESTGRYVARWVTLRGCPIYKSLDSTNEQPQKPKKTKPAVSPYVEHPPGDEEIKAYFIQEGGTVAVASVFAGQFKAHYELTGWTYGKRKIPITNWKATVRTWEPKGWQPRSGGITNGKPSSTKPTFIVENR